MKIVDTHQHLLYPERFRYSWCAGVPKLNRSFPLEDYEAAAYGLGIERTIFMECDVDERYALEEARHIQSLADRNPGIAGIVAAGRPEKSCFRSHLDSLRALPKVRGLRRVLHTQPDALPQSPLFAENLRLLAKYSFTFDMCVLPRQLPIALNLARQCPEVTFILDHCGVPDVQGKAFDPWREQIKQIAALPNMACKVSGLVAYAGAGWNLEDLRPWVEHVFASFGWNRVVWGGDWPVCMLAATLRQWVAVSLALTESVAISDRERLYWRNAERIYQL